MLARIELINHGIDHDDAMTIDTGSKDAAT